MTTENINGGVPTGRIRKYCEVYKRGRWFGKITSYAEVLQYELRDTVTDATWWETVPHVSVDIGNGEYSHIFKANNQ